MQNTELLCMEDVSIHKVEFTAANKAPAVKIHKLYGLHMCV